MGKSEEGRWRVSGTDRTTAIGMGQTGYADLDEGSAALAYTIAQGEVEMVASELADPSRLIAVAEAEGITPEVFVQEDLRLIHCAAAEARDRPLVDVLRLARTALRAEHYWNPQGPFGTGSQWSDETLVQLTQLYPPSVIAVRANARHLLALVRRWRMAEDLLAQFRHVLTNGEALPPSYPRGPGAPTTAGERVARPPAFILAPGKRGVA